MIDPRVIEAAGAFIAGVGYCTLSLIDLDGYPTAATITPSRIDGIASIRFCTGLGSNWAKRIERDRRACVCFNSDAPARNVTLVGKIEILTDPEEKARAWYDGMGMYFNGPEDPAYCVLRFRTKRYSIMLSESEGSARGTIEE